ncbi:unnamed protein product [Bemisia tabaci]|uniref:Secreted protein n=1 Tax=Bemisia tabaci TaxID=7038 RepID=A0A9P0ADL8_BEMTA|nr:unnamed protein product [Bemisia tabaci]
MRPTVLLLCVFTVVTLFSYSYCGVRVCKSCDRKVPAQPEDEDLYHLEHADPCHDVELISQGTRDDRQRMVNNAAHEKCCALVELYKKSKIYDEKKSACPGAVCSGCIQYPNLFGDMRFKCRIEWYSLTGWLKAFPNQNKLACCVADDVARYEKINRTYGAAYPVSATPRANPKIQRPSTSTSTSTYAPAFAPAPAPASGKGTSRSTKERRRSQSPPKTERGRTITRKSSDSSWFAGNKKSSGRSKSHSPSSLSRPLLDCNFD